MIHRFRILCLAVSASTLVTSVELEQQREEVTHQEFQDAVSLVQALHEDTADEQADAQVKPAAMSMVREAMRPLLEPLLQEQGLQWEDMEKPESLLKMLMPAGAQLSPGMEQMRERMSGLFEHLRGAPREGRAPVDPNAPLDARRLQESMETAKELLSPMLKPALASQNVQWDEFNKLVDGEIADLKKSGSMAGVMNTIGHKMQRDLSEMLAGAEETAAKEASGGTAGAAGVAGSTGAAGMGGMGDMAKMFGEAMSSMSSGDPKAMQNMLAKSLEKMGAGGVGGVMQKLMEGKGLSDQDMSALPGMQNPELRAAMRSAQDQTKKWSDQMKEAVGSYEPEAPEALRLQTDASGKAKKGTKARKSQAKVMEDMTAVLRRQSEQLRDLLFKAKEGQ